MKKKKAPGTGIHHLCIGIQCNLFNPDTIGADSSVLNREASGVVKYTNVVFGTGESVLFIEVSSFQGPSIEGFHCT